MVRTSPPVSTARPLLVGSTLALFAFGCAGPPPNPAAVRSGTPVAVKLGEQMFHQLEGVGNYKGTLEFFLHDEGRDSARILVDFCFMGTLTGSRIKSSCDEIPASPNQFSHLNPSLLHSIVEELATFAYRRQAKEGTLLRAEPGGEIVVDLTQELERQGIFVRKGPWEGHRVVVLISPSTPPLFR